MRKSLRRSRDPQQPQDRYHGEYKGLTRVCIGNRKAKETFKYVRQQVEVVLLSITWLYHIISNCTSLLTMTISSLLSLLCTGAVSSPFQTLLFVAVAIAILYVIITEFIRASARIPGLKGPRGLPLVGNLAQIRKNAAEQYRVWSKTFGPVFQIQLGNMPIVVVNSAAAARILYAQSSQALSSRPEFYTFHKVSLIDIHCLMSP